MHGALQHVHMFLFGSHNHPLSRQGEGRGRITRVFTYEDTEFREIKLLSQAKPLLGHRSGSPAQSCLASLLHHRCLSSLQKKNSFI